MSKMLRNYQYLVGNNPTRNYESETLKEYIEGEVAGAVTDLTNLAPEDLNTLGELAEAVSDLGHFHRYCHLRQHLFEDCPPRTGDLR